MQYGKIKEVAETFINGNISDAKATVKRMDKIDLIELIEYFEGYYQGRSEYDRTGYCQAVEAVKRLLK